MTDEELSAAIREVQQRARARAPQGQLGLDGVEAADLMPLVHARDAAQAKVAAIGTVNPRPPGLLNSAVQTAKRAAARALDWHVREQVEFNRAAIACVEASIAAMTGMSRSLAGLSAHIVSDRVAHREGLQAAEQARQRELQQHVQELHALFSRQTAALEEFRSQQTALFDHLRSQLGTRLEELRQEHAGATETARQEQKASVDALRQEQTGSVDDLRQELKRSVDGLRQEQTGSVDDLRRELKGSVDDLRQEQTGSVEDLRQELKGSVDGLRQEQTGSVDDLRRELKGSVDELRQGQKASVDALHEEQKAFVDELRREQKGSVDALGDLLREEQRGQLDALQLDLRQQLERLRQEHAAVAEMLRHEFGPQVEALRYEHGAQVEALRLEHGAQVEALRLEYGAQVEALRSESAVFAERLGSRQAAQFDEWRTQQRALMDQQSAAMEQMQEGLTSAATNHSLLRVEVFRAVSELESAYQERLARQEEVFREHAKTQHQDFAQALDHNTIDVQKRLWEDLAKVREEFEGLIHRELRLLRQRDSLPVPTPPTPAVSGSQAQIGIDWLHFAERFRGSEERIRGQQGRYLERFAGTKGSILDIGCGRGEFLEALRDAGLAGVGIDSNAECVGICRSKGLLAECADVFGYLGSQVDGSLAGAYCAQVVEHLAPAQVAELVRLLGAKMRSGGWVAVETPNPECLAIFATYFYADPTHTRPVPASLLRFYLEEAGFGSIAVERMNPAVDLVPAIAKLPPAVRDGLFGNLDYAIFARRL